MAREYRIVSADSHLEISPERWTPRVPAKYRDRAPKLVQLAAGGNGLIIENRPLYIVGLDLGGQRYEDHSVNKQSFAGSPGTGSAEQRLREQEQDGVDAEVLFTSAANAQFWRGVRDEDTYRAVIHAYNEFLVEEYCPVAPDRLIAMGIIPMTTVDGAVAELEYCARAGLKGVNLNSFPNGKGFPTPEDDRFWAASLDLNMPLTVHVGFLGVDGPVFQYKRNPGEGGFGSDPVTLLMRFGGGSTRHVIQMIMAGVFDRFPKLKLYTAETMIGWIPYSREQIDDVYERSRHWAERLLGLDQLPRPPSEYINEHCYWGFLRDPFGVRLRHEVGVERAMWGSDFPHSAGNWPHSRPLLDEMFAGAAEDDRTKMVRSNAVDYFHL